MGSVTIPYGRNSLDRFARPMESRVAKNSQSCEVMRMSTLDFVQVFGPVMSWVAGLAAIGGMVFAFLTWRRARAQDAPRAFLKDTVPGKEGLIITQLTFESRGPGDSFISSLRIDCGSFAGEMIPDGMGGASGYQRSAKKEEDFHLVVPSGQSRTVHIIFHVDSHVKAVRVVMDKKKKSYMATITAIPG